jgi:hypothetical protein
MVSTVSVIHPSISAMNLFVAVAQSWISPVQEKRTVADWRCLQPIPSSPADLRPGDLKSLSVGMYFILFCIVFT